MTKESIQIGLLGAGVVGEGILRLLEGNQAQIARRLGAPLRVRKVVARDRGKARSEILQRAPLGFEPEAILDDPEIDVVVEVIGGVEPAGTFVREALARGKSVVTANKALLAERGHELIELAEAKGTDLYFEAAVAGGVPVIRVLREALASDTVVGLRGIVNGTSNYILSRMKEEGLGFEEVLRAAQEAGYAEADPSLDIGGGDATHKLTILATLAFGAKVRPEQVATEGITHVSAVDIGFAARFGYTIKPLAIARSAPDGALELWVGPALLPQGSVLAHISGALNAVHLEGAMLGPCLLSGYGAGALPTAMSVVSDIVDVGRNLVVGASGRVPQRAFIGEHLIERAVMDRGGHEGPFYLRFVVRDRPGVLAQIAGVLGRRGVSIEQMVQDGRAEAADRPVHVVMITHAAKEAAVRASLGEIDALEATLEPSCAIRIEDA